MAQNARERAIALVSVLEPSDLVPCRILAELLAEVDGGFSINGRPPHPDGWTTKALAAHYECGASTMRGRIEGGEFGVPETEGGPRKAGRRGWLVPHHQVLARDVRVRGDANDDTVAGATTKSERNAVSRPATSSSARDARRRGAKGGLMEARRQLQVTSGR
jgi:hypothetical protein